MIPMIRSLLVLPLMMQTGNYSAQRIVIDGTEHPAGRLLDRELLDHPGRVLKRNNVPSATQAGSGGGAGRGFSRGDFGGNNGTMFALRVPAHSFRVFKAE